MNMEAISYTDANKMIVLKKKISTKYLQTVKNA